MEVTPIVLPLAWQKHRRIPSSDRKSMPTLYSSLYSRPIFVVRCSKPDMSTLVKSTLMVPIAVTPAVISY